MIHKFNYQVRNNPDLEKSDFNEFLLLQRALGAGSKHQISQSDELLWKQKEQKEDITYLTETVEELIPKKKKPTKSKF